MIVEILREYGVRWRAQDTDGIAIGYGGSIPDAVLCWTSNWKYLTENHAVQQREPVQTKRLDASVS